MHLHVLTAVSRPENLGRIAESLAEAAAKVPELDVSWHWRFDLERQHIGGQALKNAMLDDVIDGWVWCLDDDTVAHPDVLYEFWMEAADSVEAIVVSQQRTDGRRLIADPSNVRLGFIDIGQAFIRRNVIGNLRILESYEGDYHFLREALWGRDVTWMPQVLSLHNAISGVDVSL